MCEKRGKIGVEGLVFWVSTLYTQRAKTWLVIGNGHNTYVQDLEEGTICLMGDLLRACVILTPIPYRACKT